MSLTSPLSGIRSGLIIGNQEILTEYTLPVINPATEALVSESPLASKAHLEMAISAARQAQRTWQAESFDQRQQCLLQFAQEMENRQSELAELLCLEQGKPQHSAAHDEVGFAIGWLRDMSSQRLTTHTLDDTGDQKIELDYQPLGVVGAILPWNFPVALAIWKLGATLLTGNTLIMKPSPYTPLTGLLLGKLAQSVFPEGVVNVLTGDDSLGQWMVEHPHIHKISFTGSVATGKRVMAAAAQHLKPVTLELGGNDPAIVLPDADLDKVIPSLFWGAFGNSGQWCVGIKRLYVHARIYDEVLSRLVAFSKTVKMGDGQHPDTQLGPVQNRMQYRKLQSLLQDIHNKGYTIATGGVLPEKSPGYFVPVTLIDNPPEDSRIVREEPFGPILPVLRYQDYDEVITRANHSEFGLGASVWGEDLELANQLAQRLEAGTVWINEVYTHHPSAPFGGHKLSGFGVEHGQAGLMAYTQLRVRMQPRT